MAHNNTVFSLLLKLIPRHEFEALSKTHHEGRKLRKKTIMVREQLFLILELIAL
jgi:hypothetical protein